MKVELENKVEITKAEVSEDVQATLEANLKFEAEKKAKALAEKKAKANKPKKNYTSSNGNSLGSMFPQLKNLK